MERDRGRIAQEEETAIHADASMAANAVDIPLANGIEDPHPMLIALVRALARHAARMDCAAQNTGGTDD